MACISAIIQPSREAMSNALNSSLEPLIFSFVRENRNERDACPPSASTIHDLFIATFPFTAVSVSSSKIIKTSLSKTTQCKSQDPNNPVLCSRNPE
jgi:hypothetical protein